MCFLWWGLWGVVFGGERGKGIRGRMGEGMYLHLRDFRLFGHVTVVFVGELGFGFAEVFAGGVEGGVGHGWLLCLLSFG